MSDTEEENSTYPSRLYDSENKHRKRTRQDISDDKSSNDSALSLHIAANNFDSKPPDKKKAKLSRKKHLKQARDKKNELAEFTNLPENDKRNIYNQAIVDKENLDKLIENMKQKHHNELELKNEEFDKERKLENQRFKIEKDQILKDLNNEKQKVIKLEMLLSKTTSERSTQTDRITVTNVSVQTEKTTQKESKKNFTDLTTRKSIKKRLNKAENAMKKIAFPGNQIDDENGNNKKEINKNTIELIKKLVKRYGMTTQRISKLNASTTAFIFKHCRINVRKGRIIRKLLKEDNIFASEREINNMYAEFDKEIKIVETVIMVDNKPVTISEVSNLKEVITARIQRKADNGNLLVNPLNDKKLSFAFFGDDGGGSFKGGISPAECEKPNSPDNFTPVVVIPGKTTKEIIYSACERVATQIEEIDTITVEIDGEDKTFEIEWSLGGDYMTTKLFKEATSLERGEKRETFEQLPGDEGYDGPPLFKRIKPFFVLLPILHLFLGVGLLFINAIEEILKDLDFNGLSKEEKKEYANKMMEKDKQIKDAKRNSEALEKAIINIQQLIETLEDIADLKITENEMDKSIGGCCMKFCCEKVGYEAGEIRFCACCKKNPKGYHELCLGNIRCKKDLKCIDVAKYEKSGGLLSNISKVVNQLQKELDGLNVKRKKAEMKLDGLLIKKFDELGPNMKQYNEILMELNVSKQAWYQTFTGNHMRMLLKKANIFERLTATTKIQDYTEARYLKPEEIETLKTDVENLKHHMTTYLGDFSVIPKFHILIHHLVEIAEIRQTIGLFTEQQIEHVHALFNNELRRAKFLRKDKRNSWLIKEMYRRNAMKDAFGDEMEEEVNQ